MSLALLAPAALALLALVALPIIAHIARQQPREKVAFGAMLLLRRLVKRLRRRNRLKDPLLLLLRLLAMVALVLGFAGIRFSYAGGTPLFGGTGRVVLVVDRSMSMGLSQGGATLMARARADALSVLDNLPDGTEVGVVAFADRAESWTDGLVADWASARARVEAIQPVLGGSNLRGALLEARRMLGGEPGEIILISDEAGPTIVSEAKAELQRLVEQKSAVLPRPVHANPPRNVSIADARYGEGVEGGSVEVRIANYGPDPVEVPCEVVLPDGRAVPIFAELPAQGEVVERITVPREVTGGVGEVHCEDSDLPADDRRYFHLPRVGASRVMVVDGDPGETPTRSEVYFLERALAPWGGSRGGVQPDVVTPLGLLELESARHRVVFLTNVSDPRAFAPRLLEFVQKGGGLVITLGSNVSPERYNAALAGLLPSPIRRIEDLAAQGEDGVALSPPRAELPDQDLFAPFQRSGRSGFGEVRSRRVALLEPYEDSEEVTTHLRYETGLPALIERRVGQGRVVLWTSTIDYDWSNLPTQSVYMPLVQRLVAGLGGDSGGSGSRFEGRVGEPIGIELPDLSVQPEVIGADGQPVRSRLEGTWLFFTPEVPGAYQVLVDGAPTLAWVAANLDPVESDVRRYESVAAAEAKIRPELFQRSIDLAPWAVAVSLVLLLIQALLAMTGKEDT